MPAVFATKGASKPRAANPPIPTSTERRLKVPGIVGKVDHLRHLAAVLADQVVRRNIRRAQFEPSDSALVTTLAIVQYYEVDPRALAARAIGGRPPEK